MLACLLGGDTAVAQQLVNYRQSNPNNLTSIAWVVEALGQSYPDALAALAAGDYITTQSYQFTADVAALGPYGRGYRRVKFVFDTSDGTPRIVYRQDLTHLGWALGKEVRQSLLASEGNAMIKLTKSDLVETTAPLVPAGAGAGREPPGRPRRCAAPTAPCRVQQPFSVSLSLDPLTNDPELVGREIRNHLDAAGVRERHCIVGLPLKWALTTHIEVPELPEADIAELPANRGGAQLPVRRPDAARRHFPLSFRFRQTTRHRWSAFRRTTWRDSNRRCGRRS